MLGAGYCSRRRGWLWEDHSECLSGTGLLTLCVLGVLLSGVCFFDLVLSHLIFSFLFFSISSLEFLARWMGWDSIVLEGGCAREGLNWVNQIKSNRYIVIVWGRTLLESLFEASDLVDVRGRAVCFCRCVCVDAVCDVCDVCKILNVWMYGCMDEWNTRKSKAIESKDYFTLV